ncbi:DUF4126 domain-containing protein [Allonocardiopsis opalescens]|uniref:Uncharacterized protein DUF4126 n=1 Tax=Allonocardiopsis opalescens TaxID=1144618 RepID=A0A2T0QAG5_9ACTN|nr:DUF4126 domain-containing protein [Allonocardiopsis opalescens]PRY00800.1 uncharacterized protein DUF4126 [Allonocardiopsis opalescens]
MIEALVGTGLASAAGLNAYIPLLVVGLLARYTELVPLSGGWEWLEHPVTLVVLGVLLVIEVVADKVPMVDHVNDVLQTVVRPTSGGIAFGAGAAAQTVDPTAATAADWGPVIAGVLIALAFHGLKAVGRAGVNAATMGAGAPIVSTAEDGLSLGMALAAVLAPVLGLVLALGTAAGLVVLWRRRRARRRAERDRAAPPG